MIKFWEGPQVRCISKPSVDTVELENIVLDNKFPVGPNTVMHGVLDNKDGDMLVEFAGRVCYMSFDKGRPSQEYISHILEVGHGSVLEHANFTLLFEGVSRSLTHELVRHRAGFAYSQLSQRFCDPDQYEIGFVVPPLIVGDRQAVQEFKNTCEYTLENFKQMITQEVNLLKTPEQLVEFAIRGEILLQDEGNNYAYNNKVAPRNDWPKLLTDDEVLYRAFKQATYSARKKTALEAARSIMPNATETKIVVTGNARAWRHFLGMRGTIHADREIRRLACVVAKILKEESPLLFQDVEILVNEGDYNNYVTLQHQKV